MSYLVCTDAMCVPEEADLSLDLTIGSGAAVPERQAQFDVWRRAIPKPLGAQASYQIAADVIRIGIPYPASAPLSNAYFFSETTGAIDFAASQSVARDGDRLVITTKSKAFAQPIDGVLRIGAGQGLAIHATPGIVAPAAASGEGGSSGGASGIFAALFGAILGGLILNIMPCVFPILSIKALSLARSGGADHAKSEALAYTAGVIVVCVALGAVILALRAGGSAVGWAFQLQNPQTIVLLLVLSVAISLNFAGLFEVPMPGFATRGGGAGSAFVTGALAAFVATPCAGPFMGVALGAALVLPWPAALAVFAGLGLGLALPFLAIGFVPALRRVLPRPGAWMETFRHILSIPMWLTAVALAWVLGKQAGVNGMALGLLAALGAGVVLWIAGRRQRRGLSFGAVLAVLLVAIAGVGIWQVGGMTPAAAATTATSGNEQPFTEATLAQLRAQKRPVFAYFTADWCLTCKVNEKDSIETAGVQDAFKKHNVAVLVGDWTNGDPALGRFIEAHNRAGVPLYLYYAPGAADPQVLPQVLTPGLLERLAS
jgi:thiol:disulfide interchange protein